VADYSHDEVGEGSIEQATRVLGGPIPWRPFTSPERLDEIGSTNAELLLRARAGAPEGTVLLADRQSAGRGRLDRRWLDHPGGSVLCSILFRPAWTLDSWLLAGFVVALSAIEACSEVTGVDCSCKWPNDVIAGREHRKVAGVLAETALPNSLVVGIGINCNWPDDFPPAGSPDAAEIAARATSLDRLAGRSVDRDAVADRLLEAVSRRWAALSGVGPVPAGTAPAPAGTAPAPAAAAALRGEYRRRCATIGQLVRVTLADEEFTGRALDVDDQGRLLVDVGACIRLVDTGDVVHVRSGGIAGAD
jgi:BirA family biotin operon repressor/biotin-[acetyl-CoA-carboxylase] ligase